MSEFVKIKKGIAVVDSVGQIGLGVDRVSGDRMLMIDTRTEAGTFPVRMSDEDFLNLGICIIRESGIRHCFAIEEDGEKLDANEDWRDDDVDMEQPDRTDRPRMADLRPPEAR